MVCSGDLKYKLNTKVQDGQGSINVKPDKDIYNENEKVTLTANPDDGFKFKKWTGDLKRAQPTIDNVIMNEDKTIGAIFEKENSINISVEKKGTGSVEGAGTYEQGETVTLTPTAGDDSLEIWKFTGWSGDKTSSEQVLEFKATEDMTITAQFERYYDKVTQVNGKGSIELNPDKEQYKKGEQVEIIANPADEYQFVAWGGDISGDQTSQEITVENTNSADKIEFKAEFEKQSGNIITNTTGLGAIKIEPAQEEYKIGETITVTANPAQGYHFVEWAGDITGDSKSQTIEVKENMTIEAVFASNEYTISTDVKGTGSVEGAGIYEHGETVTLTPTAGDDSLEIWKFVGWSGDKTSSKEVLEFKATEDMTITAEFARYYDKVTKVEGQGSIELNPDKDQYKEGEKVQVTANTTGKGTVEGSGTYNHGETVTLTPNSDTSSLEIWKFEGWSGDKTSTNNPLTFEATEDVTVTAKFARYYNKVTQINGSGEGSISLNPHKEQYKKGETIQITANVPDSSKFLNWNGDVSGDSTFKEITISNTNYSDKIEIKANFDEAYYINISKTGEGKITLEPQKEYYSYGEEITITAEGLNEYRFTKWIGEKFNGFKNDTQTINIIKNINIEALFSSPIVFPDNNLENAVKSKLNKSGDIYPKDFRGVTDLDFRGEDIKDITGLGKADLNTVEKLDFGYTTAGGFHSNHIKDLSPLANTNLNNLKFLSLGVNPITDITPLKDKDFSKLEKLLLNGTNVTDITPLKDKDLGRLKILNLNGTNITDITPLTNIFLRQLQTLNLGNNGDIKWKWVVDELKNSGITVSLKRSNLLTK